MTEDKGRKDDENLSDESSGNEANGGDADGIESSRVTHLPQLYQNWFLDYASYVILERAVPALEDGLKPVQRRILHSMNELEDGRYNKVANLIGNTMKYHPHGDASIGDAMVQLGQRDLLIDMQGNWGNIFTGDSAAAPRYIEARLSKFALDVVFDADTTVWQASYDGRNKEPVLLPVKFPLLLAQGAEGIAVGLACKILPHNFNELIDASIKVLKGIKPHIYPDFPTGGMADMSNYNDGMKGGKILVRAKIVVTDKKTLTITEIPFGTTTSSLIDSIINANEKGKIKIRNIEDNTAENVEILIHLPAGVSPDKTIDALYAFTDCALSISPNACVIEGQRPRFLGVSEMLKIATERTLGLLQKELEVKKHDLTEQLHFASLEKIFIEKRIYRDIENCETWEEVLEAIEAGLKPHKKKFPREITREDIIKLTEIKIKRISKFDSFIAEEFMKKILDELKAVQHNLDNLTEYAIEYYKELKRKYGTGRERKTEIKSFDAIVATSVAASNQKLYVNREEGFAGYSMRKDEFVCDCSDIDDIIVFRRDGTMLVTRVAEKAFVGKDIIYINTFKRNDERTIYNLVYRDGSKGATFMKRFAVTSIIRDKEYALTRGNEGSEVLYFTANPNGEAEVVTVNLKATTTARVKIFDVNFADLAIKGRDAMGNIVTKYPVRKVQQKEKGVSTLSAQKIWYDDTVHRLNTDERGTFIGEFSGEDKILVMTQDGNYRLSSFELTSHFEEDMVLITKFDDKQVITAAYWEGEKKKYYIKRFVPEVTDKKIKFISETDASQLEAVTDIKHPIAEIKFSKEKGKELPDLKLSMDEHIPIMGMKALGKPLNYTRIKEVEFIGDPNAPKDVPPASPNTPAAPKDLLDFDDNSGESPMEQLRSKLEATPVKPKVVVAKPTGGATTKSSLPEPSQKPKEDKPKKRGPSQTSMEF
ncbi:MAG TPA: DNA gyrase/topoisomerase IV subunit A [Bacteroidia bacterium]|jgi:topoisomerase-4 subunit A|nr:DNA gyrase/topoisomerase IV subunit A [Bacteroidia bacterium]